MISKELLSEVLNIEHILNFRQSVNVIWVTDAKSHCGAIPINIYELTHKCKEWAWNLGYDLPITRHDTNSFCCKINEKNIKYHKSQWADTGSEAIFEACQYILDNKGTN